MSGLIRVQLRALLDSTDATEAPDDIELVFPVQIVSDIMEQDPALFRGVRVLDKDRNCDSGHATLSEHVFTLARAPAGQHVLADVAAKVEYANAGEFLRQTLA